MNEEAKERGVRARAIAPLVQELVAIRTGAIVSSMTSLYNSGRLTPEAAMAGWAGIAALDGLLGEIRADAARAARLEAEENRRGRERDTDD